MRAVVLPVLRLLRCCRHALGLYQELASSQQLCTCLLLRLLQLLQLPAVLQVLLRRMPEATHWQREHAVPMGGVAKGTAGLATGQCCCG